MHILFFLMNARHTEIFVYVYAVKKLNRRVQPERWPEMAQDV